MNLFELQERLKDFSQDQLVREMQAPTGTAPQYLVLSELQRRQRMMREQQAQMPQDQTTVAQDAVAAAGVPQGGLADMAQAMAPRTDMDMNTGVAPVERMRDGGVVRMQPGGLAGISRDLGAYSPEMGAAAVRPRPRLVVRNGIQYAQMADGSLIPLGALGVSAASQAGADTADLAPRDGFSPPDTGPLPTQADLDQRFAERDLGITGVSRQLDLPSMSDVAQLPAAEAAVAGSRIAPDMLMPARDMETPLAASLTGESPLDIRVPPSLEDLGLDFSDDRSYTDALRNYLSTYRGERDVSRPLEVDPLDPRSMARDIVEPAAEPLPSGYTLSRLMFPFRDPEAERLRLLGEEANLVIPPTVAVDEFTGLGSDMVLEGSQDVGLPDDLTAITPAEMDEIDSMREARKILTSDDAYTSSLPEAQPKTRDTGSGVAAPTGDDAFNQDKWLALAQVGLSLMSSKQPTLGGAIGEAGLSGITALRQARGERDARIAAQQARADRLAARERAPGYEDDAVGDLLTQRARLFEEASSYFDPELNTVRPGYEERYNRILQRMDAIDSVVGTVTMERFPGLMAALTGE